MSDTSRHVGRVTQAVVDGEPIQWQRAESLSASADERSVVAQLRLLAGLRRLQGHPSTRPARRSRLDDALSVLMVLALFQIFGATVGLLLSSGVFSERLLPAQFAICLAFVVAAFVLVSGRERDLRALRVAHVYLLVAAALARPLFRVAVARGELGGLLPLWQGVYPEAFIGFTLWRFVRVFPLLLRFDSAEWLQTLFLAAAGFAGLGLFGFNIAVAYAPGIAEDGWAATLVRTHISGHFWHVTYVFVLSALATIPWRVRRAAADERGRTLWFVLALIAGTLPVVSVSLLELTSADFRVLKAAGGIPRGVIDATVLLALLSIPFTTSYVIVAHRILPVRIVVGRAIELAVLSRALGLILASTVVGLAVAVYRQREQPLITVTADPAFHRLLLLGLGLVVLLLLRRRVLGLAARLLKTLGPRDVEDRTLAILSAAAKGRTPTEIAAQVTRELDACLGISHSALFAMRGGRELDVRDLDVLEGAGGVLLRDSALAAMLNDQRDALPVRSDGLLFRLLPEEERQWLLRAGFELLAPIRSAADDLIGVLALGSKRNGLKFSRQDVALIMTTAATLSVALESHRGDENVDEEVARECIRCHGIVGTVCQCGGRSRLARLPKLVNSKFQLLQRLGSGGMGVVYLARDNRLGRNVALKTLPEVSRAASDAMHLEAQTMAASDHPNLIHVHGLELWRSTPFLIVEHLPGGMLSDRLERGPLPLADALSIGAHLADALVVLHQAGVTHRDIKPSNIGFSRVGTPKLLDFGLARLLGSLTVADRPDASPYADAFAGSTAIAGTPLYISPEVLSGERVDNGVDLWALSLVVFEAIAGQHPFAADTLPGVYRRIRTVQPDLRDWQPDTPAPVREFLKRALAHDRSKRPTTAQDLAAGFRSLK